MATTIPEFRICFTEIKTLSTLALKHVESVHQEPLPDDREFNKILFTLVRQLLDAFERLERMEDDINIDFSKDMETK